jgi:hypothetical protein
MKIGELFRDREAHLYPAPDTILADEIARARVSYPLATSDAHALAFAASTLRKNLDERTSERNRYHDILTVCGAALLLWLAIKRALRGLVSA